MDNKAEKEMREKERQDMARPSAGQIDKGAVLQEDNEESDG